ncbi:hypothetical protein RSO01_93950 [Reyranella soli]|uniref:Glyoxalase/fosfomycin resistance/dioxygenase domain-containing protein n=1 Tax=Reyranella soli TaxID=1230389 RepID=A0A512NTG4_9HYPH|nr:hypothetical protein RSO01_93950 [Reyranella soli]
MLSYLTIGANDIPRSERFYTAVLGPLGYEKAEQKDGVAYTLPDSPIASTVPVPFMSGSLTMVWRPRSATAR